MLLAPAASGGNSFSEAPTLFLSLLHLRAKGFLTLEPSQQEQSNSLTYSTKGGHPFRDDSPEGSQFNIYKSQVRSQRGFKVKKGNVEVGSIGITCPESNRQHDWGQRD